MSPIITLLMLQHETGVRKQDWVLAGMVNVRAASCESASCEFPSSHHFKVRIVCGGSKRYIYHVISPQAQITVN